MSRGACVSDREDSSSIVRENGRAAEGTLLLIGASFVFVGRPLRRRQLSTARYTVREWKNAAHRVRSRRNLPILCTLRE